MHPLLGTWSTTQACALTANWTSDPLICRPVLNPLSHTSQGSKRRTLYLTGNLDLMGMISGQAVGICILTKLLELTWIQAVSVENHCPRQIWHHHPLAHSFILQVFTECVPGAWHSGRCWANRWMRQISLLSLWSLHFSGGCGERQINKNTFQRFQIMLRTIKEINQ